MTDTQGDERSAVDATVVGAVELLTAILPTDDDDATSPRASRIELAATLARPGVGRVELAGWIVRALPDQG